MPHHMQVLEDEEEKESPYNVPPSNEEEIYIELSRQRIKMIPRTLVE